MIWCGMTVLLLVLSAPASMLHARQAGPLPFTGSIYDASGALLPEASVSLTDGQQHERKTATDASGHFSIPSVPAGKYLLRVMLAGFAPLTQDVELAGAGDWARVVTLQVGEVQENIKVETGRAGAKPTAAPAGPPLKVGGNIRPPRKISSPNPVYPQSMKDAGIEGAVPLEAVIAGDGSVQTVRVLTAGVHPDLAIAAVDAVPAMEVRADAAERQARPHQDEGDDRVPLEGLRRVTSWPSSVRETLPAFRRGCRSRSAVRKWRRLSVTTTVGADGARDFGDVRVVDAAAGDVVARRGAQHRQPVGRRQVVHGHPSEHFLLQQRRGVRRCDAVLRRQPRRDREELEAAVPRRRGFGDALLGDRVEERLRGRALRPEVDEARPAARWCRGRRSRPAVPLVLDQRLDVDRRAAVGAAPWAARPAAVRPGRAAGPARRARAGCPSSSSVISSSEPGDSPARSRIAAGITTRPALSMVVRIPLRYHARWVGTVPKRGECAVTGHDAQLRLSDIIAA